MNHMHSKCRHLFLTAGVYLTYIFNLEKIKESYVLSDGYSKCQGRGAG